MSIIEGTVVGADTGFYPTEIEQSLRFDSASSSYLSWTPASAGNRKTWTFSTWVKRGNLGTNQVIFGAGITSGSTDLVRLWLQTDNTLRVYCDTGSANWRATTTALFRDVGAWYHITLRFDSTDATAANRIKLYVNGEQVATTPFNDGFGDYMPQNSEFGVNNTRTHTIGRCILSGYYTDGYLAETHFIDGTAYDATAFGEFKNGVWIPKTPSVTYGTNGFYLDYSNGASIGADSSGNSNNWTPTNLASTDVMLDSPTNNFATLNAVQPSSPTLSEGSLKAVITWPSVSTSTQTITAGKSYWEVVITASNFPRLGIWKADGTEAVPTDLGASVNGWCILNSPSRTFHSGTATAYGSFSMAVGDIVGFAYDADTGELWVSNNGTFLGDPVLGTSPAFSSISGTILPAVGGGGTNAAVVANFGQDSSFAGNKVPQGYTDANGRGDFYYAPPTGYLALCTANLPEPAIGPNSASTSDEHFNTVLYSGNSSTQSISGVNFQPDFTWIKSRSSGSWHHFLFDKIRGVNKWLASSLTNAEGTATDMLGSFDSDGFTTGSNGNTNNSGDTYVAWNWKANGSGVTNTDGSITSTVSANVDAGFSIVSWTSNQTTTTMGHGLGQAPAMIITKNRSSASNWPDWYVYHQSLGNSTRIQLNSTAAATSGSSQWGNTDPTSSVFTAFSGASGDEWIAYCFAEKEGFSKFGSYTGNGSTDGPFVYTGFRPAFVMTKRTDSNSDWMINDVDRSTYNVSDDVIKANTSDAEAVGQTWAAVDIVSNGFKLRTSDIGHNGSGGTYIYMAFAESGGPFKYSLAR